MSSTRDIGSFPCAPLSIAPSGLGTSVRKSAHLETDTVSAVAHTPGVEYSLNFLSTYILTVAVHSVAVRPSHHGLLERHSVTGAKYKSTELLTVGMNICCPWAPRASSSSAKNSKPSCKELCDSIQVAPYHPSSNGQAERGVQTVEAGQEGNFGGETIPLLVVRLQRNYCSNIRCDIRIGQEVLITIVQSGFSVHSLYTSTQLVRKSIQ